MCFSTMLSISNLHFFNCWSSKHVIHALKNSSLSAISYASSYLNWNQPDLQQIYRTLFNWKNALFPKVIFIVYWTPVCTDFETISQVS